jgi:hypothetical protein
MYALRRSPAKAISVSVSVSMRVLIRTYVCIWNHASFALKTHQSIKDSSVLFRAEILYKIARLPCRLLRLLSRDVRRTQVASEIRQCVRQHRNRRTRRLEQRVGASVCACVQCGGELCEGGLEAAAALVVCDGGRETRQKGGELAV